MRGNCHIHVPVRTADVCNRHGQMPVFVWGGTYWPDVLFDSWLFFSYLQALNMWRNLPPPSSLPTNPFYFTHSKPTGLNTRIRTRTTGQSASPFFPYFPVYKPGPPAFMKYLDCERLGLMSAALANRRVGDKVLMGRIEAYSCR